MSRQLDQKAEDRELKRREALIKALEFGLVDALENHNILLLGFSFKYDLFNCLMTIKAVVKNVTCVAFVGSDTVINCIVKADREAHQGRLHWRPDKYHQPEV